MRWTLARRPRFHKGLCVRKTAGTKASVTHWRRLESQSRSGREFLAPTLRAASGASQIALQEFLELTGHRRTNVANHPQSLWITLWTAFRLESQVTYRKGLFFDRSNFERCVFYVMYQPLTVFFPLEGNCASQPAGRAGGAALRRWIDESPAPERRIAFASFLRGISSSPTRRLPQFLRTFSG